MPVYNYDVGIIGAGAAGIAAAKDAARIGARTILIEKDEKRWGGNFHSGCISSKTLIHSAKVWSLARRTEEFGLPKLELPAVCLGSLMARLRSVVDAIREKESHERFSNLGVTVRFGKARFTDRHVVSIEGWQVSAETWIIATGSRPAVPALEGLEQVPYWTTDTIFSMERLPGRLLVLGGGQAGVEIAQAFRRLGSDVTIVESEQQLLYSEDEDIAGFLEERLEAEGIHVCTGTTPLKAEATGSSVRLLVKRTADDAKSWTIEGDALLVAIGRAPNTEDLDLRTAGVPFFPRGIPAYSNMRTGARGIYVCGDVNGMFPYANVAEYEARVAVANILLKMSTNADYSKIPWCIYTDPEIASVGFNEKRAKAGDVEYRLYTAAYRDVDRALVEGTPEGRIKILVGAKGRVLGCQIAGNRAGELIHEWVAAVNGRMKISDMTKWVRTYPALAGITKNAVDLIDSSRFTEERTQKFLRFLLRLRGGK
ncbi:MAG: NAD(P)/FAD-dependent oxidoreductase [Syntrophorhabdaceae bacterium]|nr:NAD(P)/FAD-dependent oxidoreductase [Syntrophorhabdaceae bacterium]